MQSQPEIETGQRLFNRDFLLLFQGQLVSNMGNAVAAAAMIFWVKHEVGSATVMGLLAASGAIPRALFGIIGGVFADNYSRKRIIVICDLIAGVLMLAAATSLLLFPERIGLALVCMFVVFIGSGMINAFFAPAVISALPDLVVITRLQAANGFYQTSLMLVQFVGMGIGGIAYRMLGAPILMLLNGVCFLVSAVTESFIRLPHETTKHPDVSTAAQRFRADAKEGFQYVTSSAGMRALFVGVTVCVLFITPMGIATPFFVEDSLGVTVDWFGYLMAAMAIGQVAGTLLVGLLPIDGIRRPRIILAGLTTFPLALIALSFCTTPWGALVCEVAIGFSLGMSMLLITTTMQVSTPSGIRGRVMGLFGTITAVAAPIGLGVTGVVLDLIDQNARLVFLCAGLGSLLVIPYLAFNSGFFKVTGFRAAEVQHGLR